MDGRRILQDLRLAVLSKRNGVCCIASLNGPARPRRWSPRGHPARSRVDTISMPHAEGSGERAERSGDWDGARRTAGSADHPAEAASIVE